MRIIDPALWHTYKPFMPIFGQAFGASLLLTPIIGIIAKKYGFLDLPPSMRKDNSPDKSRHLEKHPMLSLGGIAVIVPFVTLSVIYGHQITNLWWILVPAIILHIVGIFDTRYNLSFKTQLTFHILAATIFALSPIDISNIRIPGTDNLIFMSHSTFNPEILGLQLSLALPGDVFQIMWVVVIINALKVNAGTDALLEGNTALSSIIVFFISMKFGSLPSAILSIILAGCLLGYIPYNFYPGKILSGSSGKSVYGFLVATIAVISGAKFAVTFMVLSLPIIDLMFVIGQRIIEKKPKNLLECINALMLGGDKRHLHHKLLSIGFTEIQVAFIEYSITVLLGLLAFVVSGLLKLVLIILIPLLLLGIIFYITLFEKKKKNSDSTPESRYAY